MISINYRTVGIELVLRARARHLRGVPPSPYEEAILRSLRRIVRAIDVHSRYLETQFGLTGPQLVCLRVLSARGPMTASDLAREVDLSQATVTGIIDRLVRRQYVSRRRDSADRRRVSISVLPAGRSLVDDAPSPLQATFAKRLESLPDANQAVIATMLDQIVRMMDAEDIEAAPVLTGGELGATDDETDETSSNVVAINDD
jgi:DNA-binding MarR family transcriptional regulator